MLPAAVREFFINRDFALFWGVRIASMMAFQMLAVAVGWQVYDLTGSMLDLGYIGLVGFLPAVMLVLAPMCSSAALLPAWAARGSRSKAWTCSTRG